MDQRLKCPVFWIQLFFKFQGRPRTGYIFAYPDGSQIEGPSTIRQVRDLCTAENWPDDKKPTGHSLRVTMVNTLSGLNIPEQQINRFMMWKSNEMQSYYINRRDHLLNLAPANVISVLSDERIARIQDDLI